MGSVITRGTRARPRFYLYFREGSKPDGSPKYRMRAAKGAKNQGEARKALADAESRINRGEPGIAPKAVVTDTVELLTEWAAGLTNRSAIDDRRIIDRDLKPAFRGVSIEEITVPVLMRWLDQLKAGKYGDLSGQSQRHRLTYLSRFFGWATERGLVAFNPCLSVPKGKRPKPTRDPDMPWLKDDSLIPTIMAKLGEDLGRMFYLCRFTGMRLGEACGLRVSDMAWAGQGKIRVARSYGGPLKEDKDDKGITKWVPAPQDALDVLGAIVEARRALDGADGLLFPYARAHGKRDGKWLGWGGWHPAVVSKEFRRVAKELGLVGLDWYRSTRHSFATKALEGGASLDEVSSALGHSSPTITKKYYSHFVRQTWSPSVTGGLSGLRGGIVGADQPSRK